MVILAPEVGVMSERNKRALHETQKGRSGKEQWEGGHHTLSPSGGRCPALLHSKYQMTFTLTGREPGCRMKQEGHSFSRV